MRALTARLTRPIDDLLFTPQRAELLGLFRITLGLITIYSWMLYTKDIVNFFSDDGLVSVATAKMWGHNPSLLYYIRSPFGVKCFLALLFLNALMFTIGWATRASNILLFIIIGSLHTRNPLVLNAGDGVMRCMLFWFIFTNAGAAYSVDSVLRRMRAKEADAFAPAMIVPWAQRMMQVQLTIIYLGTLFPKAVEAPWHDGTAMYYISGLVEYNKYGVEKVMNYPTLYVLLTYGTLIGELLLPFLLWSRVTRIYGVLLGILLHGFIIGAMIIPVFGIIMLACYLPFFSSDELDVVLDKIRGRFANSRATVYYDGKCGMCRRTRRLLTLLDLFQRVRFVDFHSEQPPEVSIEKLASEMHLALPSGKMLTGFRAFRWLAVRLPATLVLAPLAYLPGAAFIGQKVYRRIAGDHNQCLPSPTTP